MIALASAEARASSCCGSILSEANRLAPAEQRSLQLGVTGVDTFGAFDPSADFRAGAPSSLTADTRWNLGGSLRLSEQWQVGASAGWVQGFRRAGATTTNDGWFSDTVLSVRWDPDFEHTGLTAALALPTGRAPEEARDRLGADSTGRGATSLRLGGTYEEIDERLFVLAGGGLTLRAPSRSGLDAGTGFDAQVLAGRMFGVGGALTAGLSLSYAPELRQEGRALPGSSQRRVTLSIGGGIPLTSSTSLALRVALDPPIRGLSRNLATELAGSCDVRWLLDD